MIPNRSVPKATVIPVLAYPDVAEAVAWLTEAFGFRERLRIADHRAQLVVGDGAVIVTDRSRGSAQQALNADSVLVRVEDADAHHVRAVEAGARIIDPPTDYTYGERQYTAEDPAGHRWTFSESVDDIDPRAWGATGVDLSPSPAPPGPDERTIYWGFARDLALEMKELAFKARDSAQNAADDDRDFEIGHQMAWLRAMSLLQETAILFQIDLAEIGLADLDPERDLLSQPAADGRPVEPPDGAK